MSPLEKWYRTWRRNAAERKYVHALRRLESLRQLEVWAEEDVGAAIQEMRDAEAVLLKRT